MPVLSKPDSCQGCPLYGDAKGFSKNEGSGTNKVLIIGEALGHNERADGLPFRPFAQAGSLLERAFKRCGFSREQFHLTNICRCQPPEDFLAGARYEFEAIQHCRQYLEETLRTFHPRAILALGGTATRELTGLSGTKQGVSYVRGYVIPCILPEALNIPVVPSFHPSFIRQGHQEMFGILCHDIQRAVDVAKTGGEWVVSEREVEEHSYVEDANVPF